MKDKKKLLVIAGAGASLDFGMPSVAEVNNILLKSAQNDFNLLTRLKISMVITQLFYVQAQKYLLLTLGFEQFSLETLILDQFLALH